MLPLAETQQRFVRALLSGDPAQFGTISLSGTGISAAAAMHVHRNTAMGGLVQALRLVFPTVDRLVGEAFFDAAACAFAMAHPPARPALAFYGDGFPQFLADYAPAAELAYLADVARLDLCVDRALLASEERRECVIDDENRLSLPAALRVLPLDHPADRIRAALADGDDDALKAVDLRPEPLAVAVWRRGNHAVVRRIALPAAIFLSTILAGNAAEAAFAAAAATNGAEAALNAIRADVFAASFCQVFSTRKPIS